MLRPAEPTPHAPVFRPDRELERLSHRDRLSRRRMSRTSPETRSILLEAQRRGRFRPAVGIRLVEHVVGMQVTGRGGARRTPLDRPDNLLPPAEPSRHRHREDAVVPPIGCLGNRIEVGRLSTVELRRLDGVGGPYRDGDRLLGVEAVVTEADVGRAVLVPVPPVEDRDDALPARTQRLLVERPVLEGDDLPGRGFHAPDEQAEDPEADQASPAAHLDLT